MSAIILYFLFEPSERAMGLGLYSISFRIFLTFSSAAFDTRPRLCKTRSTVPVETPASVAISLILMFFVFTWLNIDYFPIYKAKGQKIMCARTKRVCADTLFDFSCIYLFILIACHLSP